jgi:hypothetical protein
MFSVQVDDMLQTLEAQEDTDGNMQITIDDNGPKVKCSAIYLLTNLAHLPSDNLP